MRETRRRDLQDFLTFIISDMHGETVLCYVKEVQRFHRDS